jgi:7-carboxy-7-deazaguanine synthase
MSVKQLIEGYPKEKRIARDDGSSKLRIAEMFYDTIQGENFTGVPATFMRMQGCTLLCCFCDTVEVWRQGNPYSVDELIEMCNEQGLIERWRKGQHLIFTGGSPLIQQKALVEFIEKIKKKYGFKPKLEIENECVLPPSKDMIRLIDIWNNSPKLANSCNPQTLMYKPDVLKLLNNLQNSWFKFVITSEDDWEEIKEKFINPGLINKEKIILMPEGVTREELQKHYDIVVKLAVEENLRMTDRLHVTIWNKKTGV